MIGCFADTKISFPQYTYNSKTGRVKVKSMPLDDVHGGVVEVCVREVYHVMNAMPPEYESRVCVVMTSSFE